MNDIKYIKLGDITSVDVYASRKIGTVYEIPFPKKTFLGFTISDECMRYGTSPKAKFSETWSTKERAIDDLTILLGGQWVHASNPNEATYDEFTNTAYSKPCVKLGLKDSNYFYYKFFDTENELNDYLSKLEISSSMFGLQYDKKY